MRTCTCDLPLSSNTRSELNDQRRVLIRPCTRGYIGHRRLRGRARIEIGPRTVQGILQILILGDSGCDCCYVGRIPQVADVYAPDVVAVYRRDEAIAGEDCVGGRAGIKDLVID